jgi:UPF0716 protein FxsA
MALALLVLFIIVPLAELYVIIQVGQAIGLLPTIAILLADSLIGSWLLKHQGRAAWRRFNEATQAGKIPAREVVDGALIIFGGAFLITPGFISDFFGLLFLLPPSRALFRNIAVGFFMKRNVIGFVGGVAGRQYNRRRDARNGAGGDVVDGTAVEINDPGPRLNP